MSPPIWTATQGALLKDLRQQAGLDTATLARKHILSPAQIAQLENGGDTAFYNADIKYAIGKKLLHALGHDLPEPEPKHSETVRPVAKPTRHTERLPRSSASLSSRNFFWPLLFLLIGLGVLGVFVDKPSKLSNPINPTALPAETPAPTETTPDGSQEGAPKTESPPKAPTASNVSASKSNCDWQTNAVEIQPTSPRKSPEYVYMVAQQNVLVCVKDAEQRVATLELQAGDERSIYGPAPFSVYSAQLANVKFYFQGQFIKLHNEELRQFKLIAASR
jgi:transcriptional regulator with XRE-family HTH domain